MKHKSSSFIVKAAVIGTLYALLTLVLSPISYGVMQVRVSEALCVLALYTPAAIPGLTVGCLLANLLGGCGIADVVLGSLATLFGSALIYVFRHNKYLAIMWNVFSNAVIVGAELFCFSGAPFGMLVCIAWVGLGELVSCYAIGLPLIKLLDKRGHEIGLF